jgi:hypothetical protein
MCEMTQDCRGRTGQLGRCKECGADQFQHEPAKFSGGAGSLRQPLSDEDYRREMEKLNQR